MSQNNNIKKYLNSTHNYYGLRFIGHDRSLEVLILYSQLERQFFLFPDDVVAELSQIRSMEELGLRFKEIVYRNDYAELAVEYISQLIRENVE